MEQTATSGAKILNGVLSVMVVVLVGILLAVTITLILSPFGIF